jgi:hypothetical protein
MQELARPDRLANGPYQDYVWQAMDTPSIDPATQRQIDGLKQFLKRPDITPPERDDIRDAIHSLAFNAVNGDWIKD